MNNRAGEVIIVGGGVIGAACAYYLCQSGWKVTVVDQGGFGKACSYSNCGLVCPSHVLPLAAPGAIRSALKALVQRNSPFAIRPRCDPALWLWLYRFARRCNHRDMLESAVAIQALLNSSRDLYDELFRRERMDCEWERRGLLFVFSSPSAMDHYASTVDLLRDSFDLPAKRLDGEELVEWEPALKSGLAGGWHYPSDAHLRPEKLMSSWRAVLEARGVVVRERCLVQSIVRQGGRARAIVADGEEIAADAFVFATGAWTPRLQQILGCAIPIQPGKGYSITTPRPAGCPAIPMIFEQHRVAVTPMKSGYRIGSTMEFAGYDSTLDRRRLDLLRQGASHYLRQPLGEPVEETWFGWRPMTYDGKPIIDRSPSMSNVWIAAGHNMLGVSMAPATGRLVSELLNDEPVHLDVSPYRAGRF